MAEGDCNRGQLQDNHDNESDSDSEVVFNDCVRHLDDPSSPTRYDRGDEPRCSKRDGFSRKEVKVDYFSGEGQSWPVWRHMFERIARMNGWGAELASQLFAHLRGSALEVACGLPDGDLEVYESLVNVLNLQFGPGRQAELHLAELRNRVKRPQESFRELGRSISKLCSLAYPDGTYEERQRHAKVYFVDAVPDSELRMMILQGRPTNLDEAIGLAEELDGYRRLEKQRCASKFNHGRGMLRNVNATNENEGTDDRMKRIEDMIGHLCDKIVPSPRRQQSDTRRDKKCFNCGELGHIARRCVNPSRFAKNDRRPGPRDGQRS